MPGPLFKSGAPAYMRTAPPKPVAKPWITLPDLGAPLAGAPPADVTAAWRGLWSALGSNLPAHVNASRASRAALRKFARVHG